MGDECRRCKRYIGATRRYCASCQKFMEFKERATQAELEARIARLKREKSNIWWMFLRGSTVKRLPLFIEGYQDNFG